MSRVVILGAGISGHTAATRLRERLARHHEIIVVSPNSKWNWIPSNIWVGVGLMRGEDVTFSLAPVYRKLGITFVQAKALSIHPEGDAQIAMPFVEVEHTSGNATTERIPYDFLVNATGPKLKFDAVEGLGPGKNSLSVCTYGHAEEASRALDAAVQRMRGGERQTFLIGTSHGLCTCEGAAFEYVFNVEYELRQRGVRQLADIILAGDNYLGRSTTTILAG